MTACTEQVGWRSWSVAVRPRTLPAALAPVIVGAALALSDGAFAPLPAAACLAAAVLIQIGSNLANDYFDFIHGVDTEGRLGPTRAALSGSISLPALRLGMALSLAAACVVGTYLVLIGGWPILLIGIASIVSAVAYTGGPYPLGYHGLGDLWVFLFFGLAAVSGTYYVQTQLFTTRVLLASIPMGALITAILVVNNLRDIETDRDSGKRSLAVVLGRRATRIEYAAMLGLAYSIPVLFLVAGWASAWVLLPCLSMPLALRHLSTVLDSSEGQPLNGALAGTATLSLLFSVLFSVGLLL